MDLELERALKNEQVIEEWREGIFKVSVAFRDQEYAQLWRKLTDPADGTRYHNYEDYLRRRWHISQRQVQRIHAACETVREMDRLALVEDATEATDTNDTNSRPRGRELVTPVYRDGYVPPALEKQARELARVRSASKRLEVWKWVIAHHTADATVPQIRAAVEMFCPELGRGSVEEMDALDAGEPPLVVAGGGTVIPPPVESPEERARFKIMQAMEVAMRLPPSHLAGVDIDAEGRKRDADTVKRFRLWLDGFEAAERQRGWIARVK